MLSEANTAVSQRLAAIIMVTCIAIGIPVVSQAGVQCPVTIQLPPSGSNTFPGPPPPALVQALYNHYYNSWLSRIKQSDISMFSSPDAWTRVSEFQELVRIKLFLPYVVQGLRAGDFHLVPVI